MRIVVEAVESLMSTGGGKRIYSVRPETTSIECVEEFRGAANAAVDAALNALRGWKAEKDGGAE